MMGDNKTMELPTAPDLDVDVDENAVSLSAKPESAPPLSGESPAIDTVPSTDSESDSLGFNSTKPLHVHRGRVKSVDQVDSVSHRSRLMSGMDLNETDGFLILDDDEDVIAEEDIEDLADEGRGESPERFSLLGTSTLTEESPKKGESSSTVSPGPRIPMAGSPKSPQSPPPSPSSPDAVGIPTTPLLDDSASPSNALSQALTPKSPQSISSKSWRQKQEQQDATISPGSPLKDEKQKRRLIPQELMSPLPAFRAIKARAIAAYAPNKGTSSNTDNDEWDGYSSGSSILDDSSASDDSTMLLDDSTEEVVDFSNLSQLPNTFLNIPPDAYDYLDPDLVKQIADQDIATFAWEHHLLVKGLLELLAERDHIGVEGDVRDPSNVIKMGVLKKRYAQLYFVKYVEIRRGNLTYYEDNDSGEDSDRTTIHLRKRTCMCVAVTSKDGSSSGLVFELRIEGRPRQTWMAKSEEEREGWIRAINQAMIGETEDSLELPLDMTAYQSAVETYKTVQSSLQQVDDREEYIVAVDNLLYRQSASSALRIPVQWVRAEVIENGECDNERDQSHAPQARVRSTVSDLWNTLCNTSVELNGFSVPANSAYSAERIIGALSRCILEFDKVENIDDEENLDGGIFVKRARMDGCISEVEAVSYARSILIGCLRSKSRGDAFAALDKLVSNDKVAVVQHTSTEPLRIDVSFAGDDFSEYEPQPHDLAGWVSTKTKKSKHWKQRYFVLSEGVLSFFERAEPRPHGLRGQIVLRGAEVSVTEEDILQVLKNNVLGRQLKFDNRADFLKWKAALERSAEGSGGAESSQGVDSEYHKKRNSVGVRAMKVVKGAGNAGMKTIKKVMRRNRHKGDSSSRCSATQDLLLASTRALKADDNFEKREPTVQVAVEMTSLFNIVSANPLEKDVLLIARVNLFQAFLLSGGPNGRLARGDEVLEMEFLGGVGAQGRDHEFLEPPTVL